MMPSKTPKPTFERVAGIDFEFNCTTEEHLNVICCAISMDKVSTEVYWFPDDLEIFKRKIEQLRKERYTLLSYNATSEARALISLGLEYNLKYWIDLHTEYKMLCNHNATFMYGKQLIDGKKVELPGPRYPREKVVKGDLNYAACVYKLLQIEVDTQRKNIMREIIIEGDNRRIDAHRDEILEYCADDVKHLIPILTRIRNYWGKKISISEMTSRGKFSALTARQETRGYGIDPEATRNFSNSVPNILREIQRDINKQFPEIKPFKFKLKTAEFSWDQTSTRNWIKSLEFADQWEKTETGNVSLSLEAFTKFFDFRHDFPQGNFGAQIVRYLKTKQNLNGFVIKGDKKNFWDYVNKKGNRVRPYLNIFGSQSGRNQPSATSFLFLKSAWMRALMVPKVGNVCCGIDYSSQEFLIAGLESGDKAMIDAYHSGDPYLYWGKLVGVVPKDATKKSHELEREKLKAAALMTQYGASAEALALKLTEVSGQPVNKWEAQEMIDLFYQAFWGYGEFLEETWNKYQHEGYLKLKCGWILNGDNVNEKSVKNFVVQGMGASIMRKMVEFCEDAELYFLFPNHDAGYIEFPVGQWEYVDIFADCMREAFKFYYKGSEVEEYAKIRLDAKVWGPELSDGKFTTPGGIEVKQQSIYIDKRSENEYKKFQRYFSSTNLSLYL